MYFIPSGVESGIFWENQVDTMTADAMTTYIARPLTSTILTKQNKQILDFFKGKKITSCAYYHFSVEEWENMQIYFHISYGEFSKKNCLSNILCICDLYLLYLPTF